MRKLFILFLVFLTFKAEAQFRAHSQAKINYLKANRLDLNSTQFTFPQKDFKVIGFGAYHGSAKTEQAEHLLLKSLTADGIIKYYIPETDFSIAHYFNKYLETGDTLLLKDLVYAYGIRVPQEKSIETYNKWKKIKQLNDSLPIGKKLTVVGLDAIVSYQYVSKYITELINFKSDPPESLKKVVEMVKTDTTDFSPYYSSHSKIVLKEFVSDYEKHPEKYKDRVENKFILGHIITNLKYSFDDSLSRDSIMFNNYEELAGLYQFNQYHQFFRIGFFHLEKSPEGNDVPFFHLLIERKIYNKNQVVSVIGFLTKSRVLWSVAHDAKGGYKSHKTKGGFGIGDYKKEYFLGIENLKKAELSDLTLFHLSKKDSPYNTNVPDLIEIVTSDGSSNAMKVEGKATTDFLDYAILISDSKANTPIQKMK